MPYDGRYDDFNQPVIRGDDYEFPFTVRLPNEGAEAPFTDLNTTRAPLGAWGEIWCTGKLGTVQNRAGDGSALFQVTKSGGGIVITNALQGEAKVLLTPSETGALPPGEEVRVDVQGIDGNGKTHTLCTGVFPVRADVTRTTA